MKPQCHFNWRRRLTMFSLILLASGKLLGQDFHPAGSASPKNHPLSDGVLAWDSLTKETSVLVSAGQARIKFSFTNLTTDHVIIQDILTSCGCTTAQAPGLPWVIPAGTSGQFGLTVRLVGKMRHQNESAAVVTDQGFKVVYVNVSILPPVVLIRSITDRARDHEAAVADRQAIFHGDCANCHVKSSNEQDGKALYYAACAICHEAPDWPATMADLFAIKTPTNVSFWLDWIAQGKPGTLMPAFSRPAGGPLSDLQIAYLARFLNTADNLDSAP
jgi:mono/diheme cytochrome c family protein